MVSSLIESCAVFTCRTFSVEFADEEPTAGPILRRGLRMVLYPRNCQDTEAVDAFVPPWGMQACHQVQMPDCQCWGSFGPSRCMVPRSPTLVRQATGHNASCCPGTLRKFSLYGLTSTRRWNCAHDSLGPARSRTRAVSLLLGLVLGDYSGNCRPSRHRHQKHMVLRALWFTRSRTTVALYAQASRAQCNISKTIPVKPSKPWLVAGLARRAFAL